MGVPGGNRGRDVVFAHRSDGHAAVAAARAQGRARDGDAGSAVVAVVLCSVSASVLTRTASWRRSARSRTRASGRRCSTPGWIGWRRTGAASSSPRPCSRRGSPCGSRAAGRRRPRCGGRPAGTGSSRSTTTRSRSSRSRSRTRSRSEPTWADGRAVRRGRHERRGGRPGAMGGGGSDVGADGLRAVTVRGRSPRGDRRRSVALAGRGCTAAGRRATASIRRGSAPRPVAGGGGWVGRRQPASEFAFRG